VTVVIDNIDVEGLKRDKPLQKATLDVIQQEVVHDLGVNTRAAELIRLNLLDPAAVVVDVIYERNYTNLTADEQVRFKGLDFKTNVLVLFKICKQVIDPYLQGSDAIARALALTNDRILARIAKMPGIQQLRVNNSFLELEPMHSAVYRDDKPLALGHEHDSDDAKQTISRAFGLREKGEALKKNAEALQSPSHVKVAQMVMDRAEYADVRAQESRVGSDPGGRKLQEAKKAIEIGSQELAAVSAEIAEMTKVEVQRRAEDAETRLEWSRYT
jgi:hypothetical protein